MINNILIVDNSENDRKAIRQVLEQKIPEVQVFEISSEQDVSKAIEKNNIKVLIVDLEDSKDTGFKILEQIKDQTKHIELPVIVCIGIDETTAIERALELGAYDYIPKPIDDELILISIPYKVRNAISFMKRTEEVLYTGYHDALTKLYNRRFYEEEIKRLDIERNLPITIVIGDVNGLKMINDAFGHAKGDELLVKVAESFKMACRADDIIARWGGDEFIILLPKTHKEQAESIIKRIKETYKKNHTDEVNINISFGIETKFLPEQSILKIIKTTEDSLIRNKAAETESVRSNMIRTIINTLHEKNPREERHSNRVSEICQQIAEAIGMSEIDVANIKLVGLLHDIGKIAIEEHILNKPGQLTDEEWDIIRRHPEIGYRIIGSSAAMQVFAEYIIAHHERWDGCGYPNGLKGDEIPLISRIVTLADAFDAMTRERPYKDCMTVDEAVSEITRNIDKQFDRTIAQVFVEKVLNREWPLF